MFFPNEFAPIAYVVLCKRDFIRSAHAETLTGAIAIAYDEQESLVGHRGLIV